MLEEFEASRYCFLLTTANIAIANMVTSTSIKAATTPPTTAPHRAALQVLPSEDVSVYASIKQLNQTEFNGSIYISRYIPISV